MYFRSATVNPTGSGVKELKRMVLRSVTRSSAGLGRIIVKMALMVLPVLAQFCHQLIDEMRRRYFRLLTILVVNEQVSDGAWMEFVPVGVSPFDLDFKGRILPHYLVDMSSIYLGDNLEHCGNLPWIFVIVSMYGKV